MIGGREWQNPFHRCRALADVQHLLMKKACGRTEAHADELIGTAKRKGSLYPEGFGFRMLPYICRVLNTKDGRPVQSHPPRAPSSERPL